MKKHGELQKITGLYWRETKDGKSKYLQGKVTLNGFTDFYLKVFPNKIAKKETSPDYNLCLDLGDLITLSGLWKHESQKGTTYLQGRVGSFYVKVFKNTVKRTDSDPDYNLNISPILNVDEVETVKDEL